MRVQRQIDELLALRASEWVELLPSASDSELRALEQWLCASKLHVEEFLEIAEVELRLRQIDPARRHDVDLLLQRVTASVAALPVRATPGPFPRVRSAFKDMRAVGGALAAALVLVVAAFVVMRPAPPDEFATAIGEQKTIELPDTSMVTMNADSEMTVELVKAERNIQLHRGEAIFKVAPDPQRPFKVHTRAGVVQAVGTQFNVYDRASGETRVSVLEGKVRVTSNTLLPNGSPAAAILLKAGEEADILPDGTIKRHDDAVVANAVAWRQRRVVFNNATLSEIISEFNRYNPNLHLRLEGETWTPHRYDGVFDVADPESFVGLLAREPEFQIERREREIVVRTIVQNKWGTSIRKVQAED